MARPDFTVADILMAHVLFSGIKDPKLIAPYPGVASYRDRCLARPAWQRTIEAYNARVEAGSAAAINVLGVLVAGRLPAR